MGSFKNGIKKSSSGQATVEYLLIMMVVVALVLGIAGPLGRHLKGFSGALVGPEGYYGCLTERGLLPGDSRAADCGSHVNVALDNLSQIDGGTLGRGGNKGSSGSGNKGTFGGSGNISDSDSDLPGSDSKDGNSDPDSSSFPASKNFDSSRNKNPKRHKAKNSSDSGLDSGDSLSAGDRNSPGSFQALSSSGNKKKKKNRPSNQDLVSEDQAAGGFNQGQEGYKRDKFRAGRAGGEGYLGESFEAEEENKEVFRAKESVRSTGADSESTPEDSKKSWIPDRGPSQEGSEDKKGRAFNLGFFLKYFVIVALVVVILIVIFSQVMEYQSRD